MSNNYKKFSEIFNNDSAKRLFNTMQATVLKMLWISPVQVRINFLSHNISGYRDEEINWDIINKILTENPLPYDYTLLKPISSIEEFYSLAFTLNIALNGLDFWHKDTCKECHKEFFMRYSEVAFFESRELPLPKRCHDCRKKRKTQTKRKVGDTAMSIAMKKAGLIK